MDLISRFVAINSDTLGSSHSNTRSQATGARAEPNKIHNQHKKASLHAVFVLICISIYTDADMAKIDRLTTSQERRCDKCTELDVFLGQFNASIKRLPLVPEIQKYQYAVSHTEHASC